MKCRNEQIIQLGQRKRYHQTAIWIQDDACAQMRMSKTNFDAIENVDDVFRNNNKLFVVHQSQTSIHSSNDEPKWSDLWIVSDWNDRTFQMLFVMRNVYLIHGKWQFHFLCWPTAERRHRPCDAIVCNYECVRRKRAPGFCYSHIENTKRIDGIMASILCGVVSSHWINE